MRIFDSIFLVSSGTSITPKFLIIQDKKDVQTVMKEDDYPRLLEWVGMVRHWGYDLVGAAQCYQECAELEPINVSNIIPLLY